MYTPHNISPTKLLFYAIPDFYINCHRKCNNLHQRNMTFHSGKYNAAKRQISFKGRTWFRMEVPKFLTCRGLTRTFLDILVVYQVTSPILFFICYFSFTLEEGPPGYLVTNLVTNLSPNLVITKFFTKFGEKFVTKFGDSLNLSPDIVTYLSPNLVTH